MIPNIKVRYIPTNKVLNHKIELTKGRIVGVWTVSPKPNFCPFPDTLLHKSTGKRQRNDDNNNNINFEGNYSPQFLGFWYLTNVWISSGLSTEQNW